MCVCGVVYEAAAVYSGLAIDVQRHLLYFSDEGQGQVRELELKLKLNHTADVTSRIVDSTEGSKPRSIAVDVVNRCRISLYNYSYDGDDSIYILRES